jgi:dTDP-glucose 4,6-dehydratase
MRFLVAGAAGFLGSHLCDRLISLGHHVIGMDNLITGRKENLAHLAGHRRFAFVRHDVTQFIDVDGPLDGVYHLASPASPRDYLEFPLQTLKVGALGTHNGLGLARAKGARFLLASTSEVYGDAQVHPQPESYWGHVNPVGPRAVYDEAKRFGEAMTIAYGRFHGVETRIARIFNTYGPRMRPSDGRVVSNFIVQALRGEPLTIYGDGTQTRSLCYVDDLIDGLVALFERGDDGPTNLGNPRELTMLDLAERVLQITGSGSRIEHAPLPVDDPRARQPDIGRAARLLGWQPSVSLDEGLQRTVEYFSTVLEPVHHPRLRPTLAPLRMVYGSLAETPLASRSAAELTVTRGHVQEIPAGPGPNRTIVPRAPAPSAHARGSQR